MNKFIMFLFLTVSSVMVQAADYVEGVDYKKLDTPSTGSGDRVEVLEFFWYGCPHCYSFEPSINAWKKKKPASADFARAPAIFRPDWEIQARVYYALLNMGVVEENHGKIFEEIHKNKKRLNTKGLLIDFLEKAGVDKKRLLEEYDSFAVDGMVRKAKKKQKAYRIQGVPSLIVDGQYLVSGSMAGSYENMIKIMDYLIAKESK